MEPLFQFLFVMYIAQSYHPEPYNPFEFSRALTLILKSSHIWTWPRVRVSASWPRQTRSDLRIGFQYRGRIDLRIVARQHQEYCASNLVLRWQRKRYHHSNLGYILAQESCLKGEVNTRGKTVGSFKNEENAESNRSQCYCRSDPRKISILCETVGK